MTVDAFLDTYDKNYIAQLAVPTQAKYRSLINKHIRPAFGHLELAGVTTRELEAWLAQKQDLSWATRIALRGVVSGIFTVAIRWGFWDSRNPAQHAFVGRKRPVRRHRKLTIEETRSLLRELPPDVRLIVMFALFCTLRISEVLGLQWKHVDFDRGLILIRQRFWRGDVDVTKSERAERDIPMGLLSADLKKLYPGPRATEEFVFNVATSRGPTRDDRTIRRYFLRPAAERLGIYWPGFGFHTFRREAVTSIAAAADPIQAMRAAGHSKMDTTLLYGLSDLIRQEAAIRHAQQTLLSR